MQPEKTTIKQWAKDDRPREKLLSKNPNSLSNAELIAILLQSGTRDHSALDLAKKVQKLAKNNLQELNKLTVKELMTIKGIGQAKAVTIVAALELGRRAQAEKALELPKVKGSRQVVTYLQAQLKDYTQEVFGVLYLNNAGRIQHFEILSQGGFTSTIVDIRLVLGKALTEKAISIILCHNHPSGSLQPSPQDKELTFKLRAAANMHGINVLDHVIVSQEGYFSFADAGLLPPEEKEMFYA